MLECFTKNRKVRIGVAPIRRAIWSHKPFNLPVAIQYKNSIFEELKKFDAEIITLEGITEDGMVFDLTSCKKAAEYFKESKIDGVFIPHCNFGSEEAAAKLCKELGKPVLLWGPKDYINEEDGYRYRDSQCGLFATSKVLQMYNVPFSYIENCDVTAPLFHEGFNRFLAVVSVVKAFRHMRIGQISTRPQPFLSMKCDETELLHKFGIEVVPITLADLKNRFDSFSKNNQDLIEARVKEMKDTFILKETSDEQLRNMNTFKLCVEEWAEEEHLSAAVAMCWGPMIQTIGVAPCFILGDVCDDGFPFICETDIHGAITAVMALAATRYTIPPFLADITIRHPDNPNAELLWHCGVFAKSLAKEGEQLTINKHYNRLCSAVGEWELKGGDISIVRFDGLGGKYSMLMGNAKGTTGPRTVGAYLWVEVNDWSKWEHKLIYGPYVHHCVGIHSNIVPVLEDACRYIPGLSADRI